VKFSIYYRGQCINTVEASTARGAMSKHYKTFAPGQMGTALPVSNNLPSEAHTAAIEASKTVPGTKEI